MWECRTCSSRRDRPGTEKIRACIAGWEQEKGGEQKSRLWKEEVRGRNFSGAGAQLLTELQV